ncbi:MAG: hypothetical protein AAF657_34310 [Acidobacteriota bacterium]
MASADQENPATPRDTVPLLPLTDAPFTVHLLRSERAGDIDLFVRVGVATVGQRTYLAELRSSAGIVLKTLVLRLPELCSAIGDDRALGQTDREWQQRVAAIERFGKASECFPPLVLPASPTDDACLPPMIYCTQQRRFFTIPCPETLEPLATCRDDKLLRDRDLPLYTESSKALLYNPAAVDGDDPVRLYLASEEVPEDLAQKGVLGLGELRSALASTLSERNGEASEDAPLLPATDEPWSVLTDRDTPYALTPFYAHDFDSFADFLGGRPTDGLKEAEGQGYLFAREGSGLDAMEIMLLKLVCFSQVVNALLRYYDAMEPHLDLHPGHLVVDTVPLGEDLPHRWGFQVKLLGLSSASPRQLPSQTQVMMPPLAAQVPYCSPRVQDACLARERHGEFTIDRFHPFEDEADRWEIQGRLRDPNGILPLPSPHDRLVLEWPEALLGQVGPVLARAESASRQGGDLNVLVGPVRLDPEIKQQLEHSRGRVTPKVRYRVYLRLGIAEDIYSLGVLLLRLLLVNDQQDLGSLEPLIQRIPVATGNDDTILNSGDLLSAIRDYPTVLASGNIFYQREDREANRPNSLPDELWQQALDLAWQLVGRTDFGIESQDDDREKQPSVYLQEIDKRVHSMLSQLRLVLFRRQPMHYEIQSLIAEVLSSEVSEP